MVKGALFARYSRSAKSLRRLFLDEFVGDLDITGDQTVDATVGLRRAEELYDRVFFEYGDDSVAQLGGVHLACEQASNLLTKVLEWGRLASLPRAVDPLHRLRHPHRRPLPVLPRPRGARQPVRHPLRRRHGPAVRHLRRARARSCSRLLPRGPPEGPRRLRLRLPAGDPGQGLRRPAGHPAGGVAVEPRHLRHRPGLRGAAAAHAVAPAARGPPLRRPHAHRAAQGHPELPEAGRPRRPRRRLEHLPRRRPARRWRTWPPGCFPADAEPDDAPEVRLLEFDPDGEVRMVAAMLYPYTHLPEDADRAPGAGDVDRGAARGRAAPTSATGRTAGTSRAGRSSGRATGSTSSPTTAPSATSSATACSPSSGSRSRPATATPGPRRSTLAGVADRFDEAMERSAALHDALAERFPAEAAYAVCLAYKVRFVLDLNARAAMHLLELRTSPQGHPAYRTVGPGDAPAHRRAGRPPRRGRDDALRRPLAPSPASSASTPSAGPSSAASPADRPRLELGVVDGDLVRQLHGVWFVGVGCSCGACG